MSKDVNLKEKMELAVDAVGANWIADLVYHAGEWRIASLWGRGPEDPALLLTVPGLFAWLESALGSPRGRSRKVRPDWGELNCASLFAVPAVGGDELLLAGAASLRMDAVDRSLLRSLARRIGGQAHSPEAQRNGTHPDSSRFELNRAPQPIAGLDIAELDFESVLRRSVERSREIVGGTGAELGLLDQRNDAVRVLWSDIPGGSDGPYLVPLGKDVIGRIAQTGLPLWVNDYRGWSDRILEPAPYESVVGVPLRYRGQVIGTLTVVSDSPERQFADEDARLLEMLASQIAISIRNARLFQELGERIKTQKATEGKMVEAARLAAIGEMSASVAHELNNPLTAICGFSELLMGEFPEGSRQRENMELVLSEARRARDVVRRLLDFSRREKNMMAPVNINEAVSQVLALVQPMAVTQMVEIQFEAWEDLPLIYGDRSQVRQVLLNLVANGIQAMSKGGLLKVQTALADTGGKQVAIRVTDQGVGIPKEYMSQIFDPFFTTKPVGSGTGLGLSISKNIIMDHGGEIRVDSEEEKGTCFTVLLPVYDANPKG